MSPERMGVCAIFVAAIAVALYYATSETGDAIPAPTFQTEAQFGGINIGGKLTESSLLMPEVHFWAPGWPSGNRGEPVTTTPHRYPVVTGGNLSTIMHKGWSCLTDGSAPNDEWFRNPPEAAIL